MNSADAYMWLGSCVYWVNSAVWWRKRGEREWMRRSALNFRCSARSLKRAVERSVTRTGDMTN